MNTNIKILHLEDSPSDALLIGKGIKKEIPDSEILVVDTKEKFISALKDFPADIILSDHSLPSFNSHEALRLVQASNLQIPFVLITAAMSDEFAAYSIKTGVDDYILKDRPLRLPNAILAVLEKYRLQKERQKYIAELETKERRYRALIENSADAVLIMNTEGEPSYLSASFHRVLGYSEAEAMQMNLYDFVHPSHREGVLQKMKECCSEHNLVLEDNYGLFKHRNGDWIWLETTLNNQLQVPGVNGIVANFRDISERIKNEIALKESEDKYRTFFENSLDGILLTKTDGTILAANPAACNMFQMTESEICRAGRKGIIDIDDPRLEPSLEERKRTGKIVGELTFIRKDGSTFPGEISSSVFKDAIGIDKTSMIIRDVSDRKKKELELKNSEEQYRRLFQLSPLPKWIFELDTFNILDVNKVAVSHYGYSREEFLSMKAFELRAQEDIPTYLNLIEKFKHEKGIIKFGILNHLKKDKTPIKVEGFGYLLKYQEVDCMMVVIIDITEKENVLEELKNKEVKLLNAQKIAHLGYWELDLRTNALYWTDEVYKIWGRSPANFEVTFNSYLSTIHAHDLEAFLTNRREALTGETNLDCKHRIILPDGSIKWVHEIGNLVKDNQGKAIIFEGTIQDITEQINATQQLVISEARNRGILQSQTNYIIRTDLEGNYSFCNDKFLKDYSWLYPDSPIIGKPSLTSIQEYHHQRVIDTVTTCLANPNTVCQVEIDKPQEKGGVKSTLWDFICLTDNRNQPIEIQCVGIDITDRVKAEQALVESNTRYELVSRATSDAIWDWDLIADNLFWGDGFATLFGYDPKTMPPDIKSWTTHIHPEDVDWVENDIKVVLTGTGNNWKAEYRYLKANGDYANVIDRGFVIRDKDKKAIRMVGAMQDITEKMRLAVLLKEASQLARIGSYELNLLKNTLYWSEITKEIHEVDADFMPDLNTAINFYKEGISREIITIAIQKAVDKNIPFDLELQIKTAKGKEPWIRVIGQPEFRNGQCVRIFGSFQDIDKIKAAEKSVLKAYEDKNIILESIGDAFFALDSNWVVNYWNQHAETLLKCPKDKIMGRNLWEVFSKSENPTSYKNYKLALQKNEVVHFEDYFESLEKWFEVSGYPSPDGLSVYFKDITERKLSDIKLLELNESLQAYTKELVISNKELEQFSYIVSHNLRAPVANIMGLVSLLLQNQQQPTLRYEFLQGLDVSVHQLDNVIKDLNIILQLKKETTEKKEPVIFSQLINNIKSSIQHLIEKDRVQIITDFLAVNQFNTIKSYLHSIFYNLITNSIKYSQPGIAPVINIKTEKQGQDLVITISDNGCGIDLARKGNQVFGLYKRFHNHVEGKGMGLFMVKTQVEILGGKISIDSAVNEGTTFRMEFNLND